MGMQVIRQYELAGNRHKYISWSRFDPGMDLLGCGREGGGGGGGGGGVCTA